MVILGQAAALSGGTITLTLPDGTKYFFVQNQDTLIMRLSLPGLVGSIILNPNSTSGFGGDWLDTNGFPFFPASITLTSVTATAAFCAWPSTGIPNFVAVDVQSPYTLPKMF